MLGLVFRADTTTSHETNGGFTTVPLEISDYCPDVDYLIRQYNANVTFLQNNVSACDYMSLRQFTANQGVVYGVCGDSTKFCNMHVSVTQGMHVRALVHQQVFWCNFSDWKIWKMYIVLRNLVYYDANLECNLYGLQDIVYYSTKHSACIVTINRPTVAINIQAVRDQGVFVQYLTNYSGYVLVPYYMHGASLKTEMAFHSNCAIMLSVQQSYFLRHCSGSEYVEVKYKEHNSSRDCVARMCSDPFVPSSIFLASYLSIQFLNRIIEMGFLHSFKVSFLVFNGSGHPGKLPSGTFNCSVPNYSIFHHFLQCNLKTECEDGRDETEHCPFSGPGCQGMVASTNKCFQLVITKIYLDMTQFSYKCKAIGQGIASVKTKKEKGNSLRIFQKYFEFRVFIGYTSGWYLVPFTYSKFRKWSDNTMIYSMDHFTHQTVTSVDRTNNSGQWSTQQFRERPINAREVIAALCEFKPQALDLFSHQVVLTKPHSAPSTFTHTRQSLLVCSLRHVTHMFMHCDPNSQCHHAYHSRGFASPNASLEQDNMLSSTGRNSECVPGTFVCNDGATLVHYTLVCDFRQDCPDNSDESFCEHPFCQGFKCSNGRCVLQNQTCNEFSDCADDSDEVGCSSTENYIQFQDAQWKQGSHINLDGTGYFTQQAMETQQPCPDTHYRCLSEWLYCLPVYTRCNGFSDCVYGEDERGCSEDHCSGFYRCRASTICIHGDHLCDGWGQCRQRDDELLCDATCPEGCQCQGHSFLCRNAFPVDLFPQLRYVDASGSGMSLDDFDSKKYMIHLTLSHCYMFNVSRLQLLNLQYIDLGSNNLEYLDMSIVFELRNLRTLRLAKNPIRSNTINKMTRNIHYSLMSLDISETNFNVLNSEFPVFLPLLISLNMSRSAIEIIGASGFKNMPHLREVDIRFNPVEHFPLDLLSKSDHLEHVFSSNYKLCCENLLPKQSGEIKCSAPRSVLPSCTQLMPSEVYRVLFWVVSVCATLGNWVTFISLFLVKGDFKSNLLMIANLFFAQSCMGYHVSVVVVANEIFRDRYILFEKIWTSSLPCQLAGFLFYLSTEVSLLIIGLITIDHVIIVRFAKDSCTLKKASMTPAFIMPWCVGAVISLIPFLPGLKRWGLHGQSGLCRLALFNQYNSDQEFRWFNVAVTINFIIYLTVLTGQFVIYRHTPKFRTILNSSTMPVYSATYVIRNLATVNSASWLTLGFVLVTAASGNETLNKTGDAIVVFGLPLGSALSPFSYWWTVIMLRRQKKVEEKVLALLKSRLVVSRKQPVKQETK